MVSSVSKNVKLQLFTIFPESSRFTAFIFLYLIWDEKGYLPEGIQEAVERQKIKTNELMLRRKQISAVRETEK